MKTDLTLSITRELLEKALSHERLASFGHMGTHFDVMDKEFPIAYTERDAVVFDVSAVIGRDIAWQDIDLSMAGPGMFVAFCTGFTRKVAYGSEEYFGYHPQLSDELIDKLLDTGISIIGIDFAGIRRGKEHTPKDQVCADRGVFVVENLCNLDMLLEGRPYRRFKAHTYPVKFEGLTGLPCRVVGET